jgi:hypothetical protein
MRWQGRSDDRHLPVSPHESTLPSETGRTPFLDEAMLPDTERPAWPGAEREREDGSPGSPAEPGYGAGDSTTPVSSQAAMAARMLNGEPRNPVEGTYGSM